MNLDSGVGAGEFFRDDIVGRREAAPAAGIHEENGVEIACAVGHVPDQLRQARTIVDAKAAPALVAIEPYELRVAVAGVSKNGFDLPLKRFSPELGRGTEIARHGASQVQGHTVLGDDAVVRVAIDAELASDRADLPLLGKKQAQDLGPGLLVDGHFTPFVPGAGPDRPCGRRTGRSGRSGTPWRDSGTRWAGFRIVPPTCAPQQDAAARRSKGDASLSSRRPESPPRGAGGVRGSTAGARHACDGRGGCFGSAVPLAASTDAGPGRCNAANNRCCRGRSAGREPPGDGTRRR